MLKLLGIYIGSIVGGKFSEMIKFKYLKKLISITRNLTPEYGLK